MKELLLHTKQKTRAYALVTFKTQEVRGLTYFGTHQTVRRPAARLITTMEGE